MQIRRHRPKYKPEKNKRIWVNEMIRIPNVLLIDEKGNNLGVMPTHQALQKARDVGLDLVEVNPKEKPPVCKIMDYGKVKYEKEKIAHKQKIASKKIEIKGVRLTFKIKGHDLEMRIKQANKFLDNGNQVKIEMVLKGREKAHSDNAKSVIENFITGLGENIKIIQPVQKQGSRFSAIVAPLKSNP